MPGEPVEGYLARLPAQLPAPGTAVLALVQFDDARTPAGAAATGAGTSLVSVVFRVPVPRVQTALRFEQLEPGTPPDAALANARQRAQQAAAADAARLTGRPREVAAVEAAALSASGLPVRARAGRAGRPGRAGRRWPAGPAVRAVQAAPPGGDRARAGVGPAAAGADPSADPVPDDGPVPPA